MWEFPKIRVTLFWGPYNKDPAIPGNYIRVPYVRKLWPKALGPSDE